MPVEFIAALPAVERVISGSAFQFIRTLTTEQHVITSPANKMIDAQAADKNAVLIAGLQDIGT